MGCCSGAACPTQDTESATSSTAAGRGGRSCLAWDQSPATTTPGHGHWASSICTATGWCMDIQEGTHLLWQQGDNHAGGPDHQVGQRVTDERVQEGRHGSCREPAASSKGQQQDECREARHRRCRDPAAWLRGGAEVCYAHVTGSGLHISRGLGRPGLSGKHRGTTTACTMQ